jgi:hypothetical protein
MTKRIWTIEELNHAHPLPARGAWCWMHDESVGWYAADNNGATVCVDFCGDLLALWKGTTIISPDADVCLAVILANKGLDSLAEMATEIEREAKAHASANACDPTATRWARYGREAMYRFVGMLRRGTVKS